MLTLQRMRMLVRKGLGGLDEQDISDPDVDELLNLSFWEIESRYPFKEKEGRLTFATVAGQYEYDITTIETAASTLLDAMQSIAVVDENDQSRKLQRMTQDWFDTQFNPSTNRRGIPEYFLRQDETIVLWPIPDDVYTVRLYYLKTLDSLLVGVVESTELPREWHELVVEGAVTRGHYYRQDYNLARESENFRVMKLRTASTVSAKEEEDSRWAGLMVQWDAPEDE